MSQISKCPTLRVVLGYWEALGEVSEMRYNNLLYSSSKRSYCIMLVLSTSGVPQGKAVKIMFIVHGDNDGDGGDSE